jgi:hypothetical protein
MPEHRSGPARGFARSSAGHECTARRHTNRRLGGARAASAPYKIPASPGDTPANLTQEISPVHRRRTGPSPRMHRTLTRAGPAPADPSDYRLPQPLASPGGENELSAAARAHLRHWTRTSYALTAWGCNLISGDEARVFTGAISPPPSPLVGDPGG